MFHLSQALIEDTVLLTITLIETALLAILLLIALKSCTPAASFYALAFAVFAIFLFLFFQEQLFDIAEPLIETFQKAETSKSERATSREL